MSDFVYRYTTPEAFDNLLICSDGNYLTGLYFDCQTVPEGCISIDAREQIPAVSDTARWLDIYFNGADPGFIPEYRISQLSRFRREVADLMLGIPFGKTTSYGALARKLAENHGIPRMSAQAVGGAVGSNPISIIIPCHRVIGSDGSLTGYGGGLNNKIALLRLEKAAVES